MRRRDFLALLGVAAWPLQAAATDKPIRRVAWLFAGSKYDPNNTRRQAVFVETLRGLGWTEGKNLQIDYRWAEGDADRLQSLSKELLDQKPDVIFAPTTQVAAIFRQGTAQIPIVFVYVADPIASGLAANLSRPEANMTGFYNYDTTVLGKYVDLLREIAPATTTISVMFNPANVAAGPDAVGDTYMKAAKNNAVEVVASPVRDDAEIERLIQQIGSKPGGGLIVQPDALFARPATLDRISSLAIRHHVPAIYSFRFYVAGGGLISYGSDLIDQIRQGASYVDRLLRGTKPSQLPIQGPVKYELVINLKTARAMNLAVPPLLLTRADEVIE